MSVFHFRAVLREKNHDGWYAYTFYLDCVEAPDVTGIFLLNPDTFEPEIIEAANAEEKGLVSMDRQCVFGLVAKIKDYVETKGEFPDEIFRIA